MQNKLIIALDEITEKEALNVISEISQECSEYRERILFKFNDLIPVLSFKWIASIAKEKDIRIMLDPKWHEIPNTMKNYIWRLQSEEIDEYTEYVTIHASAWLESCIAAVEKRDALKIDTKILAITILSSLNEEQVENMFHDSIKNTVLSLVDNALKAWVDGVVSSPLEVKMIREHYVQDCIIVNPWVRIKGDDLHDQKRVLTPRETIKNWSNDIVMWRSILEAKNKSEIVYKIFSEIDNLQELKKV